MTAPESLIYSFGQRNVLRLLPHKTPDPSRSVRVGTPIVSRLASPRPSPIARRHVRVTPKNLRFSLRFGLFFASRNIKESRPFQRLLRYKKIPRNSRPLGSIRFPRYVYQKQTAPATPPRAPSSAPSSLTPWGRRNLLSRWSTAPGSRARSPREIPFGCK